MKLTKSQRLFIKAGEALARENIERRLYEFYCRLGLCSRDAVEKNAKAIATAKRKRKKLIREALEAATLEEEIIFGEGLKEAFKSHVEI